MTFDDELDGEEILETDETDEISENDENGEADEKKDMLWFRISTIAAAAAVIACGFIIGRFVIPVSPAAVTDKKAELFRTNEDYLAAAKDSEEINRAIDSLIADDERIETSFNDVVEYEKQLDKLNADFKSVNDDLYDAKNALRTAKSEHDSVKESLTRLQEKTVTLSPGAYTVGVHIPAGTYSATGNGSLLTAGTDKKLKINVNLNSEPYRCELLVNDSIKLSCEAEFKPVEE